MLYFILPFPSVIHIGLSLLFSYTVALHKMAKIFLSFITVTQSSLLISSR